MPIDIVRLRAMTSPMLHTGGTERVAVMNGGEYETVNAFRQFCKFFILTKKLFPKDNEPQSIFCGNTGKDSVQFTQLKVSFYLE